MANLEYSKALIPTEEEQELAFRSWQKLAAFYAKASNEDLFYLSLGKDAKIELPTSVVHMLMQMLSQMALGKSITLIPIDAYLTTQQAADLLQVFRPYFVGLLEKIEIPFEKVGTHRRVKARDLFRYRTIAEERKQQALDELAQQGQELDIGSQ